jgi:hypothetical protein
MIKFANGIRLGGHIEQLEIHCANCEGSTDKKKRSERLKLVVKPTFEVKESSAEAKKLGNAPRWRNHDDESKIREDGSKPARCGPFATTGLCHLGVVHG